MLANIPDRKGAAVSRPGEDRVQPSFTRGFANLAAHDEASTKDDYEACQREKAFPLYLRLYLAFAEAFFFLSAHLFLISSDNLLRPAAVRWRPGFAVARFAGATLTLPLT